MEVPIAVPITEETIRSISDFQSHLQAISTSRLRLFRGQNTDKPLLPRIVRFANDNNISLSQMITIERRMLERFRRESVPMLDVNNVPTNLELLSIAQHHGMPTRLLDWTANALAALWFAVSENPPNNEGHGVVWVLVEPNERTISPEEDIFDQRNTFFFQPSHVDDRIRAQFAWLSIPRPGSNRRFLPLEEHQRYRGNLTRLIIPRDIFNLLRRELRHLGVSHATLFPDLSGLSADIEVEMLGSWKSLS